MKINDLIKALEIIAKAQTTTAPVTLKIGDVDAQNHVHNNVLIIIDCPPHILNVLKNNEYVFSMSQEFGGLFIDKY